MSSPTTSTTQHEPPGADAERPSQIPARGWLAVLKRTFAEMGRDHLTLLAGGVAYAWFMALFPGLIAAVLTYGLVTDPADVQRQIDNLLTGLPADAQSLLADQMSALATTSSGGLGVGLIISIALALWSASAGIAGLLEAVNLAYDGGDTWLRQEAWPGAPADARVPRVPGDRSRSGGGPAGRPGPVGPRRSG